MGYELHLLPFFLPSASFSNSVLALHRRDELFEAIREVGSASGRDVPRDFNSHMAREDGREGSFFGPTLLDSYGKPLKEVQAARLKPLRSHPEVQDNDLNRAVWAYLECLPDDWPVALYWD